MLVSFILITMSTREERQSAEEKGLKLFVHGVGEDVSSTTLEDAFGRHGTVTDAYNSGRGFAFVTYSTSEEANGAIEAMEGQEIEGQSVQCRLAKPRNAPGGGRGGFGGGRGGGYGGGRPQGDGCKLFVHGVGEETSNEDLKFVFEKHGQVTDTFNPGRGFAFVTFSSPGEAQDAIDALNETEVLGRKVSINVARPKEGGGGGYRGGRGRGGFRGGRGRY